MKQIELSRRSFLQALGFGALALTLPGPQPVEAGVLKAGPMTALGRILLNKLNVYKEPDLASPTNGFYVFDEIIRLPKVFYRRDSSGKRTGWYRLGKEAFIQSAWVQPVFNRLNPVAREIPEGGCLAEITVPKTAVYMPDGRLHPKYTFYYESTFWVIGKNTGRNGLSYYELWDDVGGASWYVRAEDLRLVEPDEVLPLSPDVAPDAKRIEVNLKEQTLRAYEYDRLVFETLVTTGAPETYTPIGHFITNRKRPSRRMINEPGVSEYDLPGVPWVSYINNRGVAFHGANWHANWGTPMSHGCIDMKPAEAKWLYRWTLPTVPFETNYLNEDFGTRVDVRSGY